MVSQVVRKDLIVGTYERQAWRSLWRLDCVAIDADTDWRVGR